METYVFRVSLRHPEKNWRRIEMRGDHTLEDLHYMIQAAYEWDADHLYSFFMSGHAWDQSSEYTLPEEAWDVEILEEEDEFEGEPLDLETWQTMSEKDRAAVIRDFEAETGLPGSVLESLLADAQAMAENPELYADEEPGDVRETTLKALELKEGQSFLYLFDYGDEYRFDVTLEKINAFSDPDAIYPAILGGEGEIEQYPEWDEEDWDEEDWDEEDWDEEE